MRLTPVAALAVAALVAVAAVCAPLAQAADSALAVASEQPGIEVEVANTCGSPLRAYLLYSFDADLYDGGNCTNVPQQGLCQQYLMLPGAEGGAAGEPAVLPAAYPATGSTAWLLMEDNDVFALPSNYTDVSQSDVMAEPCDAGSAGCLSMYKVDVGEGLVVLMCDDRGAAEAPAPAAA